MAIQSTAPSQASITSVGGAQSGGTANDNHPVITGKADAGTKVNVYDGVKLIGTADVGTDGTWSFTVPDSVVDKAGKHTYTAVSIGSDNVWGPTSAQFAVTLPPPGAQVPNPPVVTAFTDDVGPIKGPITAGTVTDDPKPAMTGTGTSGDIIKLYDGDKVIGSATVDTNGKWSVQPTDALSNGTHDVHVTESNAAGESGPTAHIPFTVDTSKPDTPGISGITDNVGPVTGLIPAGGTTDDPQPTIAGTGKAGDIITILDNGTAIGSVTVADNGTWSFKPDSDLPKDNSITVIDTNAAGTPSDPSQPIAFTVDTSTPSAPKISGATDGVGPVTGLIPAGGTTDDSKPTFNGTGKAGDVIKLYDNGGTTPIGSTTVDKDGNWTFKPTGDLPEGANSITATETNPANGRVSPASDPIAFTVDTGKPLAPVISGATDHVGTITGLIPSNGVTDDAKPTFNGTGKAGDIIKLYDNGGTTPIGSTTVDKDGKWSFTPTNALSDNPHSITATDTNAAGTTSPASDPLKFTVDTSKPATPGISGITDNVGPVTGLIPAGGTTDDPKPTIAGTGKAGDIITILDNGSAIGSVTVADNGTWSFKPVNDLPKDNSITVIDTNPAGTSSNPSAPIAFTVDTSTPVAPKISGATDGVGPVTGLIPNNGTTDDTKPTFNGTGKAGDVIKLYDNGGTTPIGSTTVDKDGNWTFKPTNDLPQGANSITATETNPANGRISPASDPLAFKVDSIGPAKPTIIDVRTEDANGNILIDNIPAGTSIADSHIAVMGQGVVGNIITVYDGSTVIGSVVVNYAGYWKFPPTGGTWLNGTYDLSATQKVSGGTESAHSTHYNLVVAVDTSTPLAPKISGATDGVGPVTGLIPSNGTTDDTKPTFNGTGKAGDVIKLYDNGGTTPIGSTTVDKNGNWTFKPTNDLPQGANSITATDTNPVNGKTSPASDPIAFTVDTSTPAKPVITGATDHVGTITGLIPSNGVTDDSKPTFSGTGKAGDIIKLYDNGGTTPIGSTTVDKDGKWSFTPTNALSDNPHSITATDTNTAGTQSAPSDPLKFTVDTSKPATPGISGITDNVGPVTGLIPAGGTTDDPQPTIAGTGKAGDIITILDNGSAIGSVTVADNGTWSFKPDHDLPKDNSITVIDTNKAGTPSDPSQPIAFTVDTSTPLAPKISGATDNVGAITGLIPSNGTTDDSKPTFNGTGKAGDVIKLYDNGGTTPIGSTTVDKDGNWTFKPTNDLPQGANSITATETNPANGRISPASDPLAFTVDTSAVTKPTISNVTDAVGPVMGLVADNGVTDDAQPFFNGTGKAGDIVKLWEGTTVIGSGTVDTTGKWSIKPTSPFSNATHTITATETNPAGKVSEPSSDFHLTVLTGNPATPAAPTITDNGVNVPSGGTMPDGHPIISGNGTKGDVIHIRDNGTEIGSVTVNPDGKWSYSPATDYLTPSVPHAITVTETNLAGNTSLPSLPTTVTYSPAPTTTTTVDGAYDDVWGYMNPIASGGLTGDTTPWIQGHLSKALAPGEVVNVYRDNIFVGTVSGGLDQNNYFLFEDHNVTVGRHTWTAQVANAVGAGPMSNGFTFAIMLTGPTVLTTLTVWDDSSGTAVQLSANATTFDTSPLVKGTLSKAMVAGETFHLVRDGKEVAVTFNGLNWSVNDSGVASGSHTYTAYVMNSVGQGMTTSFTFTEGGTAPTETTTLTVWDDSSGTAVQLSANATTFDTTPQVKGALSSALKAGETFHLFRDGVELTATFNGLNWTYDDSGVAPGSHTYTAYVSNSTGQGTSASFTFTEGLSGPTTTTTLTVWDDSSGTAVQLSANATTFDTTPQVKGTLSKALASGESFHLFRDGVELAVTFNGLNWSANDSGVAPGSHTYTGYVSNSAGQGVSATFTFTEGLTAPTETTTLTVWDDSSGSAVQLSANATTFDTTPQVKGALSSALKAGETFHLFRDGTELTATFNGLNWSYSDSGVAPGNHTYTAYVSNSAGQGPSASFAFTEGGTAPTETTTLTVWDDSSGTAVQLSANATTFDTTPQVKGTLSSALKAGETFHLFRDGTELTVTFNGLNWSYNDSGVAPGNHTYTAYVSNSAGQGVNATFTFTEGLTAPTETTTLTVWDDSSGTAVQLSANGTTFDTTPQVKGALSSALKAGETFHLFRDGTELTATFNGLNWSYNDSGVAPGNHTYTAYVSNSAGQGVNATFTFTEGLTAPTETTTLTVWDDSSGTAVQLSANATTFDTTPQVKGTLSSALKAGEKFHLFRDGTELTATFNGLNWSYNDSGVAPGNHTYTAYVSNSAGQGANASFKFTEGSGAPAITNVVDAVGPVMGTVPNGGTTDDSHPTISGTGVIGNTVYVFQNGSSCGDTTVDSTGHWSIKLNGALSEGSHVMTATQFASGVAQSAPSNSWTITVDTLPHAPTETVTITNLVDDSSGSNVNVAAGGSTKDTTPKVVGTLSEALKAGETLLLFRDGQPVSGSVTVNGTSWSYQDSGVAVGSHTYTAYVQNASGHGPTASFAFSEVAAVPQLSINWLNGSPQAVWFHMDGLQSVTTNTGFANSTNGYYNMRWAVQPADINTLLNNAPILTGPGTFNVNYNMTGKGSKTFSGSCTREYFPDSAIFTFSGTTDGVAWTAQKTWGQIWNTVLPVMAASSSYYGHTEIALNGVGAVSAVRTSVPDNSDDTAAAVQDAAGQSALADQPHSVVSTHDAFTGKTGHDTVDLNADPTSYFKEATAHLEGSTVHPSVAAGATPAVNTLHLTGDHQILDLTSLTGKTAAAKVSGIEVIDLGGHANTLKLSLTDVLNLGETDLFQKDGKKQMMVNGSDGDKVDLSNSHIAGLAEGEWEQHGATQVGGVTYNVYEHSGAHTELLVQQGVQIVVH